MKPVDLLLQKGMEPWLAPYAGWLLEVLEANGRAYTVTSVRRSWAKQQQLYDRWIAGLSRYPAVPPGRSMHQLGRAMDFTSDETTLRQAGALWQSIGGKWGGEKDPIHFHA